MYVFMSHAGFWPARWTSQNTIHVMSHGARSVVAISAQISNVTLKIFSHNIDFTWFTFVFM